VRIPGFLAVVLPLALLVSLLYALGRLHRANEITAMRAAGVGFLRLTFPIWVVGVLCCGLSLWLNTTLVPWSVERSREIREELEFARDTSRGERIDRIGAVYSVGFDNREAGRMWFFNRYSRKAERAYGATISELDSERRDTVWRVAAEAWFDPISRGWVLKDGREILFNPETGEPTTSKPFSILAKPEYSEDPQVMLLISRKPSDLSLRELLLLITYLRTEHSPQLPRYAVRYYGLIANTLGPLIVIALAIPFAVSGVRVNPAVGVSKSIGLFMLYYLLNTLGTKLAETQVLDPIVAAWLPHAGMALWAASLFIRLR
jgi:lipopolysaccharide export system permease protein